MWDPLESEFIERLADVNAHMASVGLPSIDQGNAIKSNKGLAVRHVEGGAAREGADQEH